MQRRTFLKLIGKSAIISGGAFLVPSFARSESAFDYSLIGQDFIQKKQFDKAIEVLQKAVKIDPQSDWAFGLLGRAYQGIGKDAEALVAFREAVKINPEDTYSRMMIDIITQKPVNKLKKPQKPLTPLEKEAIEEEKKMLSSLESHKGLEYQVKRVVVDAGHGGFDSGAVSKNGLNEKDVTLDIALRLNERLNKEGIKSFLTRTADYYIPLSDRTVIANQYQADLFISIHINANENRQAHGSETFFCSEKATNDEAARVAEYENSVLKFDEPYTKVEGYIDIEDILFQFEQKNYWNESGKFAKKFQDRFKNELPFKSRGINSANFYVLRKAKMPSLLLETGFISNPEDEAVLKQESFRDKIVDSIMKGIK
ncbi:MAG: N-acetylmuramoyl-L-alanine amidase [Desulfobacterales bacterium]|nr:N-acetylmuramoyl-L-alanine amidase [Desulfobacterales bacterium]